MRPWVCEGATEWRGATTAIGADEWPTPTVASTRSGGEGTTGRRRQLDRGCKVACGHISWGDHARTCQSPPQHPSHHPAPPHTASIVRLPRAPCAWALPRLASESRATVLHSVSSVACRTAARGTAADRRRRSPRPPPSGHTTRSSPSSDRTSSQTHTHAISPLALMRVALIFSRRKQFPSRRRSCGGHKARSRIAARARRGRHADDRRRTGTRREAESGHDRTPNE
eukprot:ctg_3183.g416